MTPSIETRGWLGLDPGEALPTVGWLTDAADPCPTTDELYTELRGYLPSYFEVMEPFLGGAAASMSLAACALQDLRNTASVQGAQDVWLDLQAAGYGLLRTIDEQDPALRTRIRNPDAKVTCDAIDDAVAFALSGYPGTGLFTVLEHWANRVFCDVDPALHPGGVCDVSKLTDQSKAITVVVPEIGDDTAYGQIINILNQTRACGVLAWVLVLE